MIIRIKDWSSFQHFRDRTPPWIKLYRTILDDPDWHALSGDAAKCLVMLWLIASEDKTHTGTLPDSKKMAFRLRISEDVTNKILAELSQWLVRDDAKLMSSCHQDDVKLMSSCHQDDAPETERETEKRQSESESQSEKTHTQKGIMPTTLPPIDANFITPPREGLEGLADMVRLCRPEYARISELALINVFRMCANREALRMELEKWAIEHANAIKPMDRPMASIHKLVERVVISTGIVK